MDSAPQSAHSLTKIRIEALKKRSARTQATLADVQRRRVGCLAHVAQDPRLTQAWTRRLEEQLVDLRAAIELLEDGIGS